jgi:hypothetical protein
MTNSFCCRSRTSELWLNHDMHAGKDKISTTTIVAIVVPIAGSVVLFILGYCFLIRRKKYNAVKGEIGKE